jgi:hypothetical protein
MCNHLNSKILTHIFTIIYLIVIIIIMRGENVVAHRCAAEHRLRITALSLFSQGECRDSALKDTTTASLKKCIYSPYMIIFQIIRHYTTSVVEKASLNNVK